MLTVREAMQRVAQNNCFIKRGPRGTWIVAANEAPATEHYTDDLEEAVLTSGTIRRPEHATERKYLHSRY